MQSAAGYSAELLSAGILYGIGRQYGFTGVYGPYHRCDGNYITGSKDDTDKKPDTPVSSEVKIKTFTVLGAEGTIDESAGLITVTLPEGTDVSAVVPTITLSSGCSVSPISGEAVDLRSPRVYTVTNGMLSRDYTVIVSFQKSTSQQLWEKMEDDSSIADHQVVKD